MDRTEKEPHTILRCRENVFTVPLPSNDTGLHRQESKHAARSTKKTAVPSIVACESVATQRLSSVDFVGPQRARHNIIPSKT
jgi:hypothetical protein